MEDEFVYKSAQIRMNSLSKQQQRFARERREAHLGNQKMFAHLLSKDMRVNEYIGKVIASLFKPCLIVRGKGYFLKKKCFLQTKKVIRKLFWKNISDLKFKYVF